MSAPREICGLSRGRWLTARGTYTEKIVSRVKRTGYRVQYKEFDDPHTVPVEIAGEDVN